MKKFNIKLGDKELSIKLSFRSLMTYERLSGKNYCNIITLEDILIYMYSCIISSDMNLELTFDEFIEQLDESPEAMAEFLSAIMDKQEEGEQTEKK